MSTTKRELAKIAKEIRQIKAQLSVQSKVKHLAMDGYFNSVEEYFDAEEVLFQSRLLEEDLNFNDSGSRTGSFSYAVSPKNRSKVERLIEKLNGTVTEVRGYDGNGNELYDF